MMYHEHVILLHVSVYLSWVVRKPISQFDLFSSYFRPVLTLSILTVFYIYVDECKCNWPRWWSCYSGCGWCWWQALCIVVWSWLYLSKICVWTCIGMCMIHEITCICFDMVVYMGMCPNACMIDDVLGVLWLVWFVYYCGIVVYGYRCRTYNFGVD